MLEPLLIAKAEAQDLVLLPALANRHGLITGATGTGKTVTLQTMAEKFSRIGVPVFMADVKGDLSGMAAAGAAMPKIKERLQLLKLEEPQWAACPVAFWDLHGEQGHPVRATVSDMGPLLLGRMLNLNDTQAGVLTHCLQDRRRQRPAAPRLERRPRDAAVCGRQRGPVQDRVRQHLHGFGRRNPTRLASTRATGRGAFFGEPMLDIDDLMQTDSKGRGTVNILAADKLMQSPKLYSTFLLWLLSELFENLPEVGDPEKPKLVFFFDEAHLLFTDAPKALVEKIEQVVRLIRSKGVGVYFVTQNPLDVPESVLGQLGNRVQHALRAFTPKDQKAVKAAAETLRAESQA